MYMIGPDLQISFLLSCSTIDSPTSALSETELKLIKKAHECGETTEKLKSLI